MPLFIGIKPNFDAVTHLSSCWLNFVYVGGVFIISSKVGFSLGVPSKSTFLFVNPLACKVAVMYVIRIK